MHTGYREGKMNRSVLVYTSDPDNESVSLTVTAYIVPKKKSDKGRKDE